MKPLLRTLAVTLLLGGIVAVSVQWLRTAVSPREIVSADAPTPPRYVVQQARWLRLGADGQPQFRAQAAEIRFYADESAQMDTLTLDALGGFDSPWQVRSTAGSVPAGQKRIRLQGAVSAEGRVLDGEPAQFRTTELWVDPELEQLSSPRPVQIETPTRSATAGGLRTDFKGQAVALSGPVAVRYALP